MEDKFYTDLLIELECPICTNYMTPPIRQCATGHSICENCRKRLTKCALCQGIFTESRNISLEGLAVKIRYPCVNKNSGCDIKLAYNELEVHESKCAFKGYKCAMNKCGWVGRPEDISQHWASKKLKAKPFRENNVCHTKIKTDRYCVNIIEAHDRLFWFKTKLRNKTLYWAVQYVGKPIKAENYYYEIEVFKPGKPKHRILVGDYCQSIDVDNSTLFNGSCISIPLAMAEPLLGDDQRLRYNFRVNVNKEKTPEDKSERKHRDRSQGPNNKNKNKAEKAIPKKK